MICKHCGFENEGNFDFCPNCGASLTDDVQDQSYSMEESYGDYGNYGSYENYQEAAPVKHTDGFGIASMICGIVSLLCCYTWSFLPVISLVLGIVARKKAKEEGTKSTFGLVGIILSAIGLALLLLYIVFCIIIVAIDGFAMFAGMFAEMM